MLASCENETVEFIKISKILSSKDKSLRGYRKKGKEPAPANHPWRQYKLATVSKK